MNTKNSRQILTVAVAVVIALATAVGGFLIGRNAGETEAAVELSGQSNATPTVDSVRPEPENEPAVSQPVRLGEPAVDAGPLLVNESGAPDLTPDPEAVISGDAPVAEGAPADPETSDDSLRLAADTIYADASDLARAGSTLSPTRLAPITPFNDPCATDPSATDCGEGVSAVVLGLQARPALEVRFAGEVRENQIYAGECRRQLPDLDLRNEVVFAIAFNQPRDGQMVVQLSLAETFWEPRQDRPGPRITANVAPSADIVRQWTRAFEAGTTLPSIPLCVRVPMAQIEEARGDCTPDGSHLGYSTFYCASRVDLEVGGTEAGLPGRWGVVNHVYYYHQVIDGSDQSRDGLRREVSFQGLTSRILEVHVPLQNSGIGEFERNNPGAQATSAQMVTVAAYGGNIDCRSVDPTQLSTTLPVSRQLYATRYTTPNASDPNSREAVVTLSVPAALASGEILGICVFWYSFVGASWENTTVLNIERHQVVPPTSSPVDLRLIGGSGSFVAEPTLPFGALSTNFSSDQWTFDPTGWVAQPPALADRPVSGAVQLDVASLRVERTPGAGSRSLRVVWASDRPATVTATARPRYGMSIDACPPRTSSPDVLAQSGLATVNGLCPGTQYVFTIDVFDAAGTGASYAYTETGPYSRLAESTEVVRPPAEYIYEYTVELRSLPTGVSARGNISALTVEVGPNMVVPPTTTGVACRDFSSGNTRLAAGQRGADLGVVGEVFVRVRFTYTAEGTVGCFLGGTVVTFSSTGRCRFDGITPTTCVVRTLDGAEVVVTLRKTAD